MEFSYDHGEKVKDERLRHGNDMAVGWDWELHLGGERGRVQGQ